MKVIILGACGGMGRYVAKSVSSLGQIDHLAIADLNFKDAELLASQLGSHAKGIEVDVNNIENLSSILFDYDIVLNTVGPFFKFGYQVLKTSLEANCHYMDICDDWEPTEKMLELNDIAKEKNLLALLGLGASPGITNLLGRIAIDHLDIAHTIYTGWNLAEAQPESISSQKEANAAMIHGIEQIIGKVKVFSSGEYKMVRPLEEVTVDYPQLGTYKANIFGHPEAISFPHHYPEIKESLNLMHSNDDSLVSVLKLIRFFIEIKLLSKNMAAKILTWLEGTQSPDTEKVGVEMLPSVYGYAEGIKDGQKMSVATTFHTKKNIDDLSMGEGTSYPLACGVKMLADGVINQTGVHAPESGIISPDLFFDYLSKELPGDISIKPEISKAVIS